MCHDNRRRIAIACGTGIQIGFIPFHTDTLTESVKRIEHNQRIISLQGAFADLHKIKQAVPCCWTRIVIHQHIERTALLASAHCADGKGRPLDIALDNMTVGELIALPCKHIVPFVENGFGLRIPVAIQQFTDTLCFLGNLLNLMGIDMP